MFIKEDCKEFNCDKFDAENNECIIDGRECEMHECFNFGDCGQCVLFGDGCMG